MAEPDLDEAVHRLVTELQGRRRKGIPIVIITGRVGGGGVAAVHRLIQAGRLYWAVNARRPGGDRYCLVKAVAAPTPAGAARQTVEAAEQGALF